MSYEALQWALQYAPTPPRERGEPDPAHCASVLVGLAWHAGPDGRGACPSVATLVAYTRLARSTVRRCLDRLAAVGIIRPGDPAVAARVCPRADRRPQVWDLAVELRRDDPVPAVDGGRPSAPVKEYEGSPSTPVRHNEGSPSTPVDGHGGRPSTGRGPTVGPEMSMNRYIPTKPSSSSGGSGRAPARRTTTTAAELAHTAVRADAYRLVANWRARSGAPYLDDEIRALGRVVDDLLRRRAVPELVEAALDEWDRRPDARTPGYLRYVYRDVVRAQRAEQLAAAGQHPTTGPTAATPPVQRPTGRAGKVAEWLELDLAADEPDPTPHTDPGPFLVIEGGVA